MNDPNSSASASSQTASTQPVETPTAVPISISDYINPGTEAKYWREAFKGPPKSNPSLGYEHFAVAYRYGWETFRNKGSENTTFESLEPELDRGWANFKGESRLSWDQAKQATRDAWNRVQNAVRSRTKPVPHKA